MSDPTTSPLFPDCEIHHMPQRSLEWHDIRKDKLTGSNMGAWLAEQPEIRATIAELKATLDDLGIPYPAKHKREDLILLADGVGIPKTYLDRTIKARETAMYEILGSLEEQNSPDEWEVDPNGPAPRNPALWAIWNGIRLEPEATAEFRLWSGLELVEVGFCIHRSGVSGCSPDSLVEGCPWGFEGKAPRGKAHTRYMEGNNLVNEYRDQIEGCMAVTGAKGWFIQSYCPGYETVVRFVERTDYTERVAEGLHDFARGIADKWDFQNAYKRPDFVSFLAAMGKGDSK